MSAVDYKHYMDSDPDCLDHDQTYAYCACCPKYQNKICLRYINNPYYWNKHKQTKKHTDHSNPDAKENIKRKKQRDDLLKRGKPIPDSLKGDIYQAPIGSYCEKKGNVVKGATTYEKKPSKPTPKLCEGFLRHDDEFSNQLRIASKYYSLSEDWVVKYSGEHLCVW